MQVFLKYNLQIYNVSVIIIIFQIDPNTIEKFEDFPLSSPTLKGLKANKYFLPTEIQRESIGYSLRGEDILGAAKTGSGKTLAFLIPVSKSLEILKTIFFIIIVYL